MAGKSIDRVDQTEEVKRNNENQMILLEIRVIEKKLLLIEEAKEEIIEKVKKSEVKDNKIVKVIEKIKKIEVKVLRDNKQQIKSQY